ncbi:TadE/TadG family type IV pilus assembly protein [Tranquillimonas rosea]|uniref:TadE/TadG family type IV pilus assembly protein n=1 Tax=Tranquillimonas rosea TaxID=641238 RepID=UPI003BACC4A5
MIRALRNIARRFAADTRGTVIVETVLVLPLLIWMVLAIVVFVDAFRMQTQNIRATYTIGDALSRQLNAVAPSYLEGMQRLYSYQIRRSYPTGLRITVAYYDAEEDEHVRVWSCSTGIADDPMTQTDIDAIKDEIPQLADGDTIALIDSWMDYTPPFDMAIGAIEARLEEMRFENRIFVSPRFTGQLKLTDAGSGNC